ncbi:ion channel [Sediminibacterium goheungense]|uniref:Inward rectifier potassium channel n=1 Tax=Sediminibacterium goheungense TaxID=1086393 RepID=A0A4R6INB9_9BACT|nr:ion channel [Sediminibacterium goheungense]TDO23591.1 inward rectifier potassium channel [Sediminibacterium goheungense]
MLIRKLNKKAQINNETGLGTNTNLSGTGRFFNRNGEPNMQVMGMNLWQRLNIYHSLLTMSMWKFLLVVVIYFLGTNLLFTAIYYLIGIEHLGGLMQVHGLELFGEVFFFSAQTFTTVGYGRINPMGFAASFTASMEALTGLMTFAIATGIMWGRFSRPKAYIRYSKNAVVAPFRDGIALMFRMVPFTRNYLVNVEVRVTLAMQVMEDGQMKNRFFNMPLDIAKANTMTANWTLVHIINEESPIYGFTKDDLTNAHAEMLVFVQGFDESFSNTVISRTSYTYEELVFGAKFLPMYHPSEDGMKTVLHLDQLDAYEKVELGQV